jgi:hypothetical protein
LPANTSGVEATSLSPLLAPTPENPALDPELARVIAAWPDLPEAIRRAVLALVGTVGR